MTDIDEIEAVTNAATPGPWECGELSDGGNDGEIVAPNPRYSLAEENEWESKVLTIVETDGGLYWRQDGRRRRSRNVETEKEEPGEDQIFCAKARTWVPELVNEVKYLRQVMVEDSTIEIDNLREEAHLLQDRIWAELIKAREFGGANGDPFQNGKKWALEFVLECMDPSHHPVTGHELGEKP